MPEIKNLLGEYFLESHPLTSIAVVDTPWCILMNMDYLCFWYI
jgi:hypothetical protein